MNLTRLNIVLSVLLVITFALTFAMEPDYSIPNIDFLADMKHSPALGAYASSSVFPNGRALQSPVHGTIARGELPLDFQSTKEDAKRAGEEIQNPLTGQPSDDAGARLDASIQRGSQIYGVFCVSCHGPTGGGDGLVAKRGFPPPPSLTAGKSVTMKDGQLFHILTYGQGSMASMAAQLNRDRRWDVINYIRNLQEVAKQNQPKTAVESTEASSAPKASQTSQDEGGQR